MGRLALALIFALASVAHAQPAPPAPAGPPPPDGPHYTPPAPEPPLGPRYGVIQMGGSVTGTRNSWLHGAYMIEGGVAVPKLLPSPYYVLVRGALMLAGGTVQSDWSGDYKRYAIGGELGGCTRFVCGFLDLDIAYQHATLYDNSGSLEGDRTGPHIYGRGGIDLGGRRFHVRGAIEIGRWKTHHSPSEWLKTGGIFIAVGVRI
jgi:hypothetical protein